MVGLTDFEIQKLSRLFRILINIDKRKNMKKLLLASVFRNVADELKNILPAPAEKLTVVCIPTAADPYDDKWFVKADRDKLVEMGFSVVDLNITDQTKESIEPVLDKADVIFVAGGNTFYLLDQARKSGFAELLPKLVEKGVIYVGSSAGSYFVCPTIEAATWKNQDKNIIGMTDFTAINLVPFLLFVHYKLEHSDLVRESRTGIKFPIRILTDEQAILVLDNEYKLVGKGEEIKV